MMTIESLKIYHQNDNSIVDKKIAHDYVNDLLSSVPHASGINNDFFLRYLNPLNQAPSKKSLQNLLQNWLEQKRILRRSLVQGLEATVASEHWSSQMAYLDLLKDEIEGCHVNLAWESLSQPALVAGFELPHSVDSQNSPEIVDEMKELRNWQAELLRKDFLVLVAVAIFERQSQPVLRRTYQALNAWYGLQLSDQQREKFELYFAVHTSISDINDQSTFEDVFINIPANKGVEEKHAAITGSCFVDSKKKITIKDLKQVREVFDLLNYKQNKAWEAVYKKCISLN